VKRAAKISIWIISSIFAIVLFLSAVIQINWVQHKLVNLSSNYLTQNLGLEVSVESVNLQPFKGDFSFMGIKCDVHDNTKDTNLVVTINALSVSGLDLILNGGNATNITITDLHIAAKSIEELRSAFSTDTTNRPSTAVDPLLISKLVISNMSWVIGEGCIGKTEYLELRDIKSASLGDISISSFIINNTTGIIPKQDHLTNEVNITAIKGSLDINGMENRVRIDTLISRGLNVRGEVYSLADGEIESNAIFSLNTDTLITTPSYKVGALAGEFGYQNGMISLINVDTEKGLDIQELNLFTELKLWELEASTNSLTPHLNIIASGSINDSQGLLVVHEMGEVNYNASWDTGEIFLELETERFTSEYAELNNIYAILTTDLNSSIVGVKLTSKEIDLQGLFSNNIQDWMNWFDKKISHHSALLSTGDMTVKEGGIVFDYLHKNITLSQSNSTSWEIYTDSHKIRSTADWIVKNDMKVESLLLDIEGGNEENWLNLTCASLTKGVGAEVEELASDMNVNLHLASVWTIGTQWKNSEGIEGNVGLEGFFNNNDWDFKLYEATIPLGSDYIALTESPADIKMRDSHIVCHGVNWAGGGFEAELMGAIGKTSTLALTVKADEIDSTSTKRWFGIPLTASSNLLEATIGGSIEDFNIDLTVLSEDIHYKGIIIPRANIDLLFTNETCNTSVEISGLGEDGAGEVIAIGSIDIADFSDPFHEIAVDLVAGFEGVPLDYINPFLQANTAQLGGTLSGDFTFRGDPLLPTIEGDGRLNNATVKVPYLGTNYDVVGNFYVTPDAIELNGLEVGDGKGGMGFLVGTAFHNGFSEWNVDVSLIMDDVPMEVMNIPPSTEALFYGSGFATGDVNVFGYDRRIVIEANLTTTEGTEFVLPMDVSANANWSSFIHIHNDEEEIIAEKIEGRNKTVVELNLNIDVTPVSKARIIFDETLGDEIIGSCLGHIHIGLDDFERLEMFGALEVVEGSYLFTLGNFISKKFTAKPGGMISWFGDPYKAEINLETYYATRTSIRPIVPEALGSSKQKVELILALKGELMRPGITFDIQVPEADARTKAALASLIANEEERNRQAISLLVLQQFLPAAWQSAAIGGTGIQENSTELISAQLGNWLSGLSDDVSIGIDYDAANDYGDEAALAVALSTELLNDRLHIEGEVGTTNLYTGTMDEIQLQDIRLKYDITDNGNIQLTGYSTQRASIPGLEGESVQGVGIIFHKDFDKIRDFFKRED
jgi:hypothetical protein|tara:strand:- start:103 stop:3816 length:3714 start_codon:yes stop_codon:yes gene_type:complete